MEKNVTLKNGNKYIILESIMNYYDAVEEAERRTLSEDDDFIYTIPTESELDFDRYDIEKEDDYFFQRFWEKNSGGNSSTKNGKTCWVEQFEIVKRHFIYLDSSEFLDFQISKDKDAAPVVFKVISKDSFNVDISKNIYVNVSGNKDLDCSIILNIDDIIVKNDLIIAGKLKVKKSHIVFSIDDTERNKITLKLSSGRVSFFYDFSHKETIYGKEDHLKMLSKVDSLFDSFNLMPEIY